MEGVTTALVLYAFLCSWKPDLVRNKTQFYAAFAFTLIVILLGGTRMVLAFDNGLQRPIVGVMALLQTGAVALMFLGTGGSSLAEVSEEMRGAFEVLRRGETTKEVIIPLESQRKAREAAALRASERERAAAASIADEEAALDAMDAGATPTPPTPTRTETPKGPIPLD